MESLFTGFVIAFLVIFGLVTVFFLIPYYKIRKFAKPYENELQQKITELDKPVKFVPDAETQSVLDEAERIIKQHEH